MSMLIAFGRKLMCIPLIGKFSSRVFEYIVRIVYSSDISCSAVIPSDVKFVHGHNIVIGENVVIGHRCKIFNGVTLGNKDTESSINLHPVIGDDCIISTGAKVLGQVRIGDRSIVGANSVVLRDVPSDSVAVGIPARYIPRDKSIR